MKHVLVHGPRGCGKTRNKDRLAKAFGCSAVVDEVSLAEFKARAVDARVKTLFLTNEDTGPGDHAAARRAEVLSFNQAMQCLGA